MFGCGPALALWLAVLSIVLNGCASKTYPVVASDEPATVVDLDGLRVPERWQLLPFDPELQWNNMRLYGACTVATEVGREPVMAMWYVAMWSQVTVNAGCAKLVAAKDDGIRLAERIQSAGGSVELSRMCHRSDRLVIEELMQRFVGEQFPDDAQAAARRSQACAELAPGNRP